MQTIETRWRCADGVAIPVTVHAPPAPRAALVVGSAMGVPRQFYRRYAQYLAAQGIAAVTFDYRGIADAAAVADVKGIRLQHWGEHDLQAVLVETRRQFPGVPLFLAGHSCGGQLHGLAAAAPELAGLVLVAASSPNVRHWRGAGRAMMQAWVSVVVPLASRGTWFPARRLRFSTVDIPAGVMRQWAAWIRSPRYLFSPEHGLDTARYRGFAIPALAYSFADDGMTTRAAADALLAEMPGLAVTRRHLSREEIGARPLGHLGYFREAARDTLWAETVGWIERQLPRVAPVRAALG